MLDNFPRLLSLPAYSLGTIASRVHELRSQGRDVIDLSQINPDLAPPQQAIDALIQSSLLPHNHRYSSSIGISILRKAFSSYYRSRFSVDLNPDLEIVLTSGTKEGLSHLLLGSVSPGDTALVPVPSYPLHTASVCLADASFIGVPLWKSYADMSAHNSIITSEYDFFFLELESRYTQTWPRPKLLIISFPHNPTTTIASKCFYERLLEFARKYQVFIINDFAHGDLYFDQSRCVSLLSVEGAKDHSVELYSLSKGFSLPGWRIGCAAGSSEYIAALKKVKSYIDFGTFQPLQIAASKLLEEETRAEFSEGIIYENCLIYNSRKEVLREGLERLGWSVPAIHASPFVWAELPLKFHHMSAEKFCENLLSETLVATSPGTGFHEISRNLLRFSLAQDDSRLHEAICRIESFQNGISG